MDDCGGHIKAGLSEDIYALCCLLTVIAEAASFGPMSSISPMPSFQILISHISPKYHDLSRKHSGAEVAVVDVLEAHAEALAGVDLEELHRGSQILTLGARGAHHLASHLAANEEPEGAEALRGYYLALAVATAFSNKSQAMLRSPGCLLGVATALESIAMPNRLKTWMQCVVNRPEAACYSDCEAPLALGGLCTRLPDHVLHLADFALTDEAIFRLFLQHDDRADACGDRLLRLLNHGHASGMLCVAIARILARGYELQAVPSTGAAGESFQSLILAAHWLFHPKIVPALRRLERAMGLAPHSLQYCFSPENSMPMLGEKQKRAQLYEALSFAHTTALWKFHTQTSVDRDAASDRAMAILCASDDMEALRTLIDRAVVLSSQRYVHFFLSYVIARQAAHGPSEAFAWVIASCCAPLIPFDCVDTTITRWLLDHIMRQCHLQFDAQAPLWVDQKRRVGDPLEPRRPSEASNQLDRSGMLFFPQQEIICSSIERHFKPERMRCAAAPTLTTDRSFVEYMRSFDAKQAMGHADHNGAILGSENISWGPGGEPFEATLSMAFGHALKNGAKPYVFASMPVAQQRTFLQDLSSWEHIGCAALLVSVLIQDSLWCWQCFASGFAVDDEAFFALQRGQGIVDQMDALDTRSQVAALHRILNPDEALSRDDFLGLELRLILNATQQLTAAGLAKICRPYTAHFQTMLLESLADRLWLNGFDEKECQATAEYLLALLDNQEISTETLAGFAQGELGRKVFAEPDAGELVYAATSDTARRDLYQGLLDLIAVRANLVPEAEATYRAIINVYQKDLTRVLPLTQVDTLAQSP